MRIFPFEQVVYAQLPLNSSRKPKNALLNSHHWSIAISTTALSRTHQLAAPRQLAAGHSLDTAVTTAQAGACVLVGFGCGLVEGVRLALDADARVAGTEEVGALLADGEVVDGLVGAGLGEAG